ncbi:bacterio-opsin activator domain-containing protein [Haloterrigena alkaliphila]|uniref:bacterio-opsin activator domain-containing protein n=1 Tax=Haloterrigena alkaliphila TaxID=2816475 RepID=UPI003CE53BAA
MTDEVHRIHRIPLDAEIDLETAIDFYHPEDRPKIERALERAVEAGEAYDLELRIVLDDDGDGSHRWVRTIGDPVEADGDVVKIHGSFQDITDRKRRERELERYETIIQAIGDPVYTLDASGDFRFINDAIEPLTGYDPETMIGEPVSEFMRPSDLERAQELVRELRREDKPYETFEMALETADGDAIEAENHVALLPTEDGEFAGTAGVVRDISERKERERDLERTRDLLERTQRMARVGGWELQMEDDPSTAIWTDELYRLHDLPRDIEPDLETTLACYHPDDRPFVREQVETAVIEEVPYDYEARLRSDSGDVRWVHAMGEPIHDDGELETFRGSVQDITDRKRRELALESLHETARGLLDAETEATVAELVVETAAELLETEDVSVAVYLLDSGTNRFEPVAFTPAFAPRSDDPPSVAIGDSDSVLWTTYVTGTQTVVDDAAIGDGSALFGGDAPGGLLVPIGDHGVFVLVAPPATIDEEARQLFETLVATTETAFDRLESEATLRERDAELEARNRRLRRQIQITDIIRGIDRSLIGADGRAEIERTVPDQLVEADTVDFAWIGDLDAGGTQLEPRAWAGSDPEYLDALPFDLEADSSEPAVLTARSETPTLAANVVEGLQQESWRTTALDAGFQSALAVPLSFEEYSYGVLAVYSDEPDAFSDLEETVFAELGEGIANAINAAETQEALHAETLVELTLGLEGDDLLSRIASATGGTVTYEGLGTHSGSEPVLFFETSGVSADDVRDALEDLVSVTDARLIADSDDGCLFEATVTGETIASRLVRHGGSPRAITADGDRTEITVDVPTTTDVREFVEMLGDRYEGVELQSRRHVQRAMHTRQELVTSLFDDLTDRQLEVLRTAYLAGFFEWPRESTGEEIAEMLDVTQPTVNRHLRIGQQRLLSQLFATERLAPIEPS